MSTKKRELLSKLTAMITALTMLSGDAAELEYKDNNVASLDLKKAFREFKNNELKAFEDAIHEMRHEIMRRPKAKDGRQKAFSNLGEKRSVVSSPTPERHHDVDSDLF